MTYPLASDVVDGLEVIYPVPNLSSIDASLDQYEILDGIREVPMGDLNSDLADLFYAANDFEHAYWLASAIASSEQIAPLIVVVDREGPYVLEGAHRLGALGLLKKKSFPALVILDLDE